MVDLFRIATPVSDLLDRPNGRLDRQLLFGEAWQITERRDGFAQGRRPRDGYAGWVAEADLKHWAEPSHRIGPMGAHIYTEPNIKTNPPMLLPYQSEVTVIGEEGEFVELAGGGYVFHRQIEPLAVRHSDPASVCLNYLNVPYLWGGNSQFGLDCSGLISAGLRACGLECPGDSSDQERLLGNPLKDDAQLTRNDLIFWKGHVGIMANSETLIHANGHHMRVVQEPLVEAAERILGKGDGPITSRKRLA